MKTIKQLLITIAVLLYSVTTYAYDFEVDGIYYYITSSSTVEVSSGDIDYSGEVVIPSTVNYNGEVYSVTYIGERAFRNCSSLTSIEIPNSVTTIGWDAFGGCSSLTSVMFGENSQLTSIEYEAFSDCSSLTSIEIPNSVTYIGERAFRNCSSLTSIEIPNSVTTIGQAAFSGCSSLTSVMFGENSQLTYIGGGIFGGCSSLTSIEIPNSVTTIGFWAFSGCSSLTSIEIPDSVTTIEMAFDGCSSLTSVMFGGNSQLTTIGYTAFNGCSSLTSIEIPNSVTTIGVNAFSGCSSLTSVMFGENSQLTSIETIAFGGCSSLTSIEIPNSVTSIGGEAFYRCSSLTSIEIPNSVTSIRNKAFIDCTSLKDFKIEDGYNTLELGYRLFENCTLETIYLGRNISYDNSENPEDIPFDDMITLKSLTIGSNVTEIPEKTFHDCANLESVYMRGVPPIIYDDTFSNTSFYIATLYVPEGTLAFYQAANIWKNFWNIQEYKPTSIEDIETDEVNFTISSNGISLSNANNSAVAIYNINGVLVKKIDKYTGEEITLENGVYIVSVGNRAMKIKL